MGAAAAVCFARAGYRVLLWARDAAKISAIQSTVASLDEWLNRHVGRAAENEPVKVVAELRRIDVEAEVVIEAIAERMEEKAALFRAMPEALARGAMFVTTTSGLSITALGRASGTGCRLVGAHFWNPPHLMPLVEVIRGTDTSEATLEDAVQLIESIGKIAVRVEQDIPGFVGNRMLHALWREAIFLVQQGVASPADIDRVARLTFGLRLPAVGPLENMDLVGLDLIETIHQYLLADLSRADRPLAALDDRVAAGKLGMKSGSGFHEWTKDSGTTLIERRDRQIFNQIKFLRELGAL